MAGRGPQSHPRAVALERAAVRRSAADARSCGVRQDSEAPVVWQARRTEYFAATHSAVGRARVVQSYAALLDTLPRPFRLCVLRIFC